MSLCLLGDLEGEILLPPPLHAAACLKERKNEGKNRALNSPLNPNSEFCIVEHLGNFISSPFFVGKQSDFYFFLLACVFSRPGPFSTSSPPGLSFRFHSRSTLHYTKYCEEGGGGRKKSCKISYTTISGRQPALSSLSKRGFSSLAAYREKVGLSARQYICLRLQISRYRNGRIMGGDLKAENTATISSLPPTSNLKGLNSGQVFFLLLLLLLLLCTAFLFGKKTRQPFLENPGLDSGQKEA